MPELALDHRQRHPLPGELNRVSMTELMLVPTSAQTPLSRPARYADLDQECAAYGVRVAFGSA
jgi:hypothetical protein